jgi:murein DD-endopeptidase MepM/ murein hydrolase activator NlpD
MNYDTLRIFRPCISKKITQKWGENRACIDPDTGKVYGVITHCPPGVQSVYQRYGLQGHNGYDIAGLKGEDIAHAARFDGWMRSERDRHGGVGVDVVSDRPLFFAGPIPNELKATAIKHTQDGETGFLHYVKMRYWHLSAVVGHDGKKVKPGTTIGLMGNTGVSSGTHLHFAPKWCDKNGGSVGTNNGYFGAFDPKPYYNHTVVATDMPRKLPLSAKEIKDIEAQLGAARMLLLALQKIMHKV